MKYGTVVIMQRDEMRMVYLSWRKQRQMKREYSNRDNHCKHYNYICLENPNDETAHYAQDSASTKNEAKASATQAERQASAVEMAPS
jgi:hypothetical protein